MKKTLSIILSVLMIVSCVPLFASAAEPIALTTSNIKIVPPSYEEDSLPFGSTYGDFKLIGGECWYIADDGTETLVPGTFNVLANYQNTIVPRANEIFRIPIEFIPDDTSAYTSPGRLSNGRVPLISGTWPQLSVYETEGLPQLVTEPKISNVIIGKTFGDIIITGGTAAIDGKKVEGKFELTDNIDKNEVITKTITVQLKFVPDDLETYPVNPRIYSTTITPKQAIRFIDADGKDIVPEVSTLHDAVFGETVSIGYSLAAYLNCNRTSFEYFDAEGNSLMGTMVPLGRNEITVKVTSKDTNYEESTLKFILVVEPKEFTVTPSYSFINGKIKIMIDNKLNIPGEFDVYVDGELIGTTENKEVNWKTENSCTINIEIVHKDESGRYILTNGKQEFIIAIPRYLATAEGSLSYSASVEGQTGMVYNYYMGDVITLECTDAEFYAWSFSLGGEKYIPEGLKEEDLKNSVVTFIMPDSDLGVSADTQEDFAEDISCSHLCHSENPLIQMIWKLISFIFRLFNIQQYCDCGITHYDAPIFG